MRALLKAWILVVVGLAACPESQGAGEGEGEGEGEPLGAGVLEAEPAECNLGSIALGVTARCDVTLRNSGDGPLRIVSVLVDGVPSDSPSADVALLPGRVDAVVVPLEVTATATGITDVVFTFVTDAAPLDVTVRFFGTCAPTAIATVRINGASAAPPYVAAVSDDVVLDATTSAPCPGSAIASAAWSVVSRPGDAATTLTTGTALTTAITGASPGTIEIALAVVDDAGGFSTNDALVSVRYLPQLAFTVDDSLLLGLAPHLLRGESAVDRCTSLDCFDGEGCGFVASAPPEWDGVSGRTAGDPLFDEAAGVSVRLPVDGAYLVGVHAREDATAATALTVDGSAPATSSRDLIAGDFWTVARVTFAGGVATTEAVDTVDPAVTCDP